MSTKQMVLEVPLQLSSVSALGKIANETSFFPAFMFLVGLHVLQIFVAPVALGANEIPVFGKTSTSYH